MKRYCHEYRTNLTGHTKRMSQQEDPKANLVEKLESEKDRLVKMASAMLTLDANLTDLQARAETDDAAKAKLQKLNNAIFALTTQHMAEIMDLADQAERRAASFCKALVECPNTLAPDGAPSASGTANGTPAAADSPDRAKRPAKKRKFA